eukprot:2573499-Amphidinium_carterae.1
MKLEGNKTESLVSKTTHIIDPLGIVHLRLCVCSRPSLGAFMVLTLIETAYTSKQFTPFQLIASDVLKGELCFTLGLGKLHNKNDPTRRTR